MKKIKIFFLIIFMFVTLFALTGCNDENNNLNEKIKSEIKFLDYEIISLMNKLNNINLDNYDVKEKTVKSQSSHSEQSSQNSGNGESGQSGGSEQNSGEEQNNKKQSQSQNTDTKSQSEENTIKVLQMEPSNILVTDRNEIDWDTIKSEIELIYTSWNSVLIDLYSLDIERDNLLQFGQLLDAGIIAAKNEDKAQTLATLANMYSYLAIYADRLEMEDAEKNIYKTKANVLSAYAVIEQDNWQEAIIQLNLADENYTKVVNDINYIQKNKENVTKIYVSIKELRNSISLKDKDIFYIKYKNIMNSID